MGTYVKSENKIDFFKSTVSMFRNERGWRGGHTYLHVSKCVLHVSVCSFICVLSETIKLLIHTLQRLPLVV